MSNCTSPRWPMRLVSGISAAGFIVLLAACGSSGSAAPASTPGTASASSPAAAGGSQAPVPAENNPPGDIPDTTVYVPYQAAGGHVLLKVPEGWSRRTTAAIATFVSNLNSITVSQTKLTAPPTVSSARSTTIPALQASTLAFRLVTVRPVSLPGGSAIEIVYQVNSPPNSVTGKQYRLVVERFELYRAGRGAVLELSSAVGSDNVDPWRIVSESFRWR